MSLSKPMSFLNQSFGLLSSNQKVNTLLISLSKVDRKAPLESIERINSCSANFLGMITNSTSQFSSQRDLLSSSSSYKYGYSSYSNTVPYSYYNIDVDPDLENPEKRNGYNEVDINDQQTSIKVSKLISYVNENFNKLLRWLDN